MAALPPAGGFAMRASGQGTDFDVMGVSKVGQPIAEERSRVADFEFVSRIGEGSYSSVWKVRRR